MFTVPELQEAISQLFGFSDVQNAKGIYTSDSVNGPVGSDYINACR
jgi:hypothetical protein